MELVCYGEVLWDIFEDEYKLGGAPFNVAAIAGLLGLDSAIITAVGNDELGKKLLSTIGNKKVKIVSQTNEHPTGTVNVKLDSEKNPLFDIKKNVAYDYIEYNDEVKQACSNAKFFCFGSLAQRNNVSRETLKKILENFAGIKIYDFNFRQTIDNWKEIFRESIEYADILKINEEELQIIKELYPQESLESLMKEHNLKYVFVTLGEKGAMLYSGNEVLHADAPKVEVVDTTGCGDAFTAGIAYSLANGFDNKKMLEYSVNLAAKIASVKGAIPESV
jgi:fructokinase